VCGGLHGRLRYRQGGTQKRPDIEQHRKSVVRPCTARKEHCSPLGRGSDSDELGTVAGGERRARRGTHANSTTARHVLDGHSPGTGMQGAAELGRGGLGRDLLPQRLCEFWANRSPVAGRRKPMLRTPAVVKPSGRNSDKQVVEQGEGGIDYCGPSAAPSNDESVPSRWESAYLGAAGIVMHISGIRRPRWVDPGERHLGRTTGPPWRAVGSDRGLSRSAAAGTSGHRPGPKTTRFALGLGLRERQAPGGIGGAINALLARARNDQKTGAAG